MPSMALKPLKTFLCSARQMHVFKLSPVNCNAMTLPFRSGRRDELLFAMSIVRDLQMELLGEDEETTGRILAFITLLEG